jgi:hypothetical protein
MKPKERVITPLDPRFLAFLDAYADPHLPSQEAAISHACDFLYDTYGTRKRTVRLAILARALRVALLETLSDKE